MRQTLERIAAKYQQYSTISLEELREWQLHQIQVLVRHHYDNNEIYRKMLEGKWVHPHDIKSLDDLIKLPIVEPHHIQDFDRGFYTKPEEIGTFLHTSGSTGKQKIIPVHSGEETQRIFENSALGFYIVGMREPKRIHCTFPFGPWPSAFFCANGAELIGPTIKADMSRPIEWHIEVLDRLHPAYVMASPSYISVFAQQLMKKGRDPSKFGFEVIMIGGEPSPDPFRMQLEEIFRAPVMDLYGCAEISPASMECPELKNSGRHHILPEVFMEVRDMNDKSRMLQYGERGEMIVTPLFKTSMPVIRYNMRDIVTLRPLDSTCSCGLNLPMMSRVQGRTDDMFKYGGAEVYPEVVHAALGELVSAGYPYAVDKYQVHLRKDGLTDRFELRIELPSGAAEPDEEQMARIFEEGLKRRSGPLDYVFKASIVNPIRVVTYNQGELYNGVPKLRRVVDERGAQPSIKT